MPKKQTTQKKKTDQPPWGEPLVWSLTPQEIFDVVGHASPATTSARSLLTPKGLHPAAPRMDAINKRTGYSCHWLEYDFESGQKGPDGRNILYNRRAVELKIGDCFLDFWWDHAWGTGEAGHEWARKESERVFMLLSRMIGVPVSRKIVVGARR